MGKLVINYTLPLLEQVAFHNLGFRPYFIHWQYLVEVFHILMENINNEDIRKANRYSREVVADTEILYGNDCMSYNIHQLLHLAQNA